MIVYNLDPTDAALNSNAPFQYGCPLSIGAGHVPSNGFLSIKVYLDSGMMPPVRMSKIELIDSDTQVTFVDAAGAVIGTWRAHASTDATSLYVSGFIYDSVGILVGHITCLNTIPGILRGACRMAGGVLNLAQNDFMLMPQCCESWYKGKMRAFGIDGNWTVGNMEIRASANVLCSVVPEQIEVSPGIYRTDVSITFDAIGTSEYIGKVNVYNDKAIIGDPGICSLSVICTGAHQSDDMDTSDKHFIIKSSPTSNLRVITSGNTIYLKGVADV